MYAFSLIKRCSPAPRPSAPAGTLACLRLVLAGALARRVAIRGLLCVLIEILLSHFIELSID